ncbi:MAG: thioredoxin family protein [Synechococcales cyanobacterium CRU_2_2]|nr:thioredoxin family protein [Synechococcales cyanobacterium CRU_2_2]
MAIGTYAPDFELPGTDQAVHHLARYLERYRAIGIVFLGNTCPAVARYLPRLLALQTELADQGFTLIGINANDTIQSPADSLEHMQQFAQTQALTFPYLRDVTQDVAQTFRVTQTPEFFVLDQSGIIRYRGSIDDCPADAGQVQVRYGRDAALAVLQGQELAIAQTPALGSPLCWRTGSR